MVVPRLLSDEQPGDYKDLLFESNVQPYPNGSLNFMQISKESEGQYLCEAKNNNGSGVSKVIFLKVNGKKAIFYPSILIIELCSTFL